MSGSLYIEPLEIQQDNELAENKTRRKDTRIEVEYMFKTFFTAFSPQLVLVLSVQKAIHSSSSIKENILLY